MCHSAAMKNLLVYCHSLLNKHCLFISHRQLNPQWQGKPNLYNSSLNLQSSTLIVYMLQASIFQGGSLSKQNIQIYYFFSSENNFFIDDPDGHVKIESRAENLKSSL